MYNKSFRLQHELAVYALKIRMTSPFPPKGCQYNSLMKGKRNTAVVLHVNYNASTAITTLGHSKAFLMRLLLSKLARVGRLLVDSHRVVSNYESVILRLVSSEQGRGI